MLNEAIVKQFKVLSRHLLKETEEDHTELGKISQSPGTKSRPVYTKQKRELLDLHCLWGTRWRNWLRHCATSRKVADSIPDCVIGIFQ